MEFFTKYKDLFEVPPGLSVPNSRLRLDNELFIEKPYIGTYSQEYSLNGKLRQLKKDYYQFESEVTNMSASIKTPKRVLSRSGKETHELQHKGAPLMQKYNQSRNDSQQQQKRARIAKEKKKLSEEMMRRESWLKDEQNNIMKHSQIDHIFNNKLSNIYQLEDIKVSTLPKINQQYQGSLSMDVRRPKQNNFTIKQRSKANLDGSRTLTKDKALTQSTSNGANQRRQKAKLNLQFRRKKLQQLLRTLW